MAPAEETGEKNAAQVSGDNMENPAEPSQNNAVPGEDRPATFVEEDAANVIQVIRNLEEQLDYAFSIREALEADLKAANAKVADLDTRNYELGKRIEFLDPRDKLAVQLQSELDFLNEEKTSSIKAIQQLKSQVSELTEENNALEKDLSTAQSALADMKKKAIELQSEVIRREDKTAAMEEIKVNLAETRNKLMQATDRVHDLELQLDVNSTAKDTIELDLKSTKQVAQELRQEVEELKMNQETYEKEKRSLRLKAIAGEYENKRLLEQHQCLDRKLSESLQEKEAVRTKLREAQKAFFEIQGALEATKQKVKKRWYSEPKKK